MPHPSPELVTPYRCTHSTPTTHTREDHRSLRANRHCTHTVLHQNSSNMIQLRDMLPF